MNIKFDNNTGLVPVIIQDYLNLKVLMLGYMNQEAFDKTLQEKRVTFFSRSKNRLWTKGETSGNFLELMDWKLDCDKDTILIKAKPLGPTCHKGTTTCFAEETDKGFLYELQKTISDKIDNNDENSYTNSLFKSGINKVAQKVGEEAVELIIETKDNNDELFLNEAADLFYHYLILLKAKGFTLEDVETILKSRSK
ncbi:bifunctional phosphoribosyl-AMP cyclohydrolase/phosphoribosyl-ATP diphosphatase HisIE [Epilithonimonas hominis]|uniref:Histidine biosynthesis bifunctional protein HisIE n=1 Tax=Epilithonimonas hominis TaxID=420404 RepID=A0A3N0X7K1_9FLAO|nr:bifunctional phosphoribosyl-AMP cyclohydrolase/phosphoribosyl-ATP diphosphatase HisIE [Epilithonimonas hominis]ROI13354.1 bifunctional phosphoribosyl-AMP cyclohydrolase/phosphoribosyl-ATP diphosphatase HisIE [Epilithonimonas hominis]